MKLNSKTVRMSRSAEGRNASKDMVARGRASTSREALFAPDVVLTGRRFRRANGLSRADGALFEALLRQPGGGVRPGITVALGDRTDLLTSPHGS